MITPAMELAEKILDQIERHPESHDQSAIGQVTECGTVACVAGWAMYLSGPEYYTISEDGWIHVVGSGSRNTNKIAGGLLGLDYDDADNLFFVTMRNNEAKEALKYIAKGESIPWSEIWND